MQMILGATRIGELVAELMRQGIIIESMEILNGDIRDSNNKAAIEKFRRMYQVKGRVPQGLSRLTVQADPTDVVMLYREVLTKKTPPPKNA